MFTKSYGHLSSFHLVIISWPKLLHEVVHVVLDGESERTLVNINP